MLLDQHTHPAIVTLGNAELPVVVSAAGERATYRFVEFFTAQIRNPNTRRAYHTDISQFSPLVPFPEPATPSDTLHSCGHLC